MCRDWFHPESSCLSVCKELYFRLQNVPMHTGCWGCYQRCSISADKNPSLGQVTRRPRMSSSIRTSEFHFLQIHLNRSMRSGLPKPSHALTAASICFPLLLSMYMAVIATVFVSSKLPAWVDQAALKLSPVKQISRSSSWRRWTFQPQRK